MNATSTAITDHVVAPSSQPSIRDHTTYTGSGTTGTLTYGLQPNASGTGTITVTVTDSGSNVGANVSAVRPASSAPSGPDRSRSPRR